MNRVTGAIAIVVLWVLLFGEVSVANLLGGLVVAALAVLAFPRPKSTGRHRLSPLPAILLLVYLAVQLLVSSVRVARAVITPTPARLRTAVVRVPLRTDSELVATLVGDLISLTPGTLTLDVRYDPPHLFVHALGESDPAVIVETVRRLEGRVLQAVAPRPAAGSEAADS